MSNFKKQPTHDPRPAKGVQIQTEIIITPYFDEERGEWTIWLGDPDKPDLILPFATKTPDATPEGIKLIEDALGNTCVGLMNWFNNTLNAAVILVDGIKYTNRTPEVAKLSQKTDD